MNWNKLKSTNIRFVHCRQPQFTWEIRKPLCTYDQTPCERTWAERARLEQWAAEKGKICKQRIQQMEGKLQKVKASYKDPFAVKRGKGCDNRLLPTILEELFPEKKQPPSRGKKRSYKKINEETAPKTNGYRTNYKTSSSTAFLERFSKSWWWCFEPIPWEGRASVSSPSFSELEC